MNTSENLQMKELLMSTIRNCDPYLVTAVQMHYKINKCREVVVSQTYCNGIGQLNSVSQGTVTIGTPGFVCTSSTTTPQFYYTLEIIEDGNSTRFYPELTEREGLEIRIKHIDAYEQYQRELLVNTTNAVDALLNKEPFDALVENAE